jgi:hypothetical protein
MERNSSGQMTHLGDSQYHEPYVISPCACRNITLTSTPGSWYTLDLNFAHAVAEICGSCRFSLLSNITLANARRGTSPYVDFFVGKPGSVLVLDGVYRHRIACSETHDSAETLKGLRRSSILPGGNQTQKLQIANITYRVSCTVAVDERCSAIARGLPPPAARAGGLVCVLQSRRSVCQQQQEQTQTALRIRVQAKL